MLYASLVWVEALTNSRRRKKVNSVYLLIALRVLTADEAVLVMADMVLVDIITNEVGVLDHAKGRGT